MIFQAHKGVSVDAPENTMPAFLLAKNQGYKIIELDVSVTKDKKFVLLHDATINRTARDELGKPLASDIAISDIDYGEALRYDFGIWFSEEFRGTRIPLFKDVLKFAKECGISLKIDNKYQKFSAEDRLAFFELLKPYEDIACLTCDNIAALKEAADVFSDMRFHYDGAVSDEILDELRKLLPKERLTVWLPMQNSKTTWVRTAFATKELADAIKKCATLGIWIISEKEELTRAWELGAEIIETNGELKPDAPYRLYADMHTHSEHSHDSTCRIEDMLLAHLRVGTKIFAVTDHFDTASYKEYDLFTPIKQAHSDIDALRKKYPDLTILKGIEIGEGFWFPDVLSEAENMLDYDVVIGSVHLVRHKTLNYAYSKIDFSALSDEEIDEYLNCYFDDVIEMLDTQKFDILAHLTCPIRYIKGKYKRKADLTKYSEKIEKILTRVIASGISLEVNTSSVDTLGDFMPGRDILVRYKELGGKLITIGSDAHTQDRASFGIRSCAMALKTIGFDKIYYYKNRIPHPIEI